MLRLRCALQILLDLARIEVPIAACLLPIAEDLEIGWDEIVMATGQQEVVVSVAAGREFGKVVVGDVGLTLGR